MSFTLENFKAEAERKYGGLVIEDGPNGPITLQVPMMLTDTELAEFKRSVKVLNELQEANNEAAAEHEMEENDGAANDIDAQLSTLDNVAALRQPIIDVLVTVADRKSDFKKYVKDLSLPVVLAIKEAWEAQTDPKAA